MKDSVLRLQDKTILLTGPFNGTTQALLRTMTEFGSDIAFVSDQTPTASKYVDGINEAREVHQSYGRALYLHLPMRNKADINEVLGGMAGGFGRADVLIDATPLAWNAATDADAALSVCRHMAEQVMPFLAAKKRGRIIYLFEDECLNGLNMPGITPQQREGLVTLINELARGQRGKNITVNGLALGVTDDFILRHYAKTGSIRKTMDELQKVHAGLKLVEPTEVGMGAAYLASALSASLTGTILRLTHGFHLGSEDLPLLEHR
jgi:2-hydroxycyclohexanecarboxyl-CoA dehydrogenase